MFKTLLQSIVAICLFFGCAEYLPTDSNQPELTQSKLDALQDDMTKTEVEDILGTKYTTLMDAGKVSTHQWLTGEGDSTRSITVNFTEGKLSMKIGTNLPND